MRNEDMNYQEKALDKQDAAEVKNYSRVPNMLIFGYQNLSPQEKWLLVCLRHLCGKRGTRHLSLRFIAEQTGFSTGVLSTSKDKNGKVNEGMIKHLHTAGLIHSEIKQHNGKGNAQYHITITDVWQLNQSFFETRSDFGQDKEEDSQPVRNSDEPVQISDKLVQISDEPVRIPVQYQDYIQDTIKITDKTVAQSASAIAPHTPALKNDEDREDGRDAFARDTENAVGTGNTPDSNALAVSDAHTGNPVVPLPEPKKTRTRKPKAKAEPVNAEQQARISAVFDTFDALARECSHDPDFRYDRSKAATEAITAFLAITPTPTVKKLEAHYRDLFKRPASKDGFLWRDNMSIAAVLRDYGRKPKIVLAPDVPSPTVSGRRRLIVPPEALAAMTAGGGR